MNPPAFQFYADDFLGGTVTMSYEARGAYITALCIQWNKGGVSEDEMDRIGSAIALPSFNHVKSKFKKTPDGLFKNKRLEDERSKQASFRLNRSESGKYGAKKRWHSHSTAIASGMANHSSPSPSPSPMQERVQHAPEVNGKPTRKEVLAKAQHVGLVEWKANDWFDEMEGCGWLDYQHRPIVDWIAVMTRVCRKWESDGRPMSPPKPRTRTSEATKETLMEKELRSIERQIKQL